MTDQHAQYNAALKQADSETGPVVIEVVCEQCGQQGRRQLMSTVTSRPRGMYYLATREDVSVLGAEMARRKAGQGKEYPERFRPIVEMSGPRESRVTPGTERVRALLDYPGLDPSDELPAWCPRHGTSRLTVGELLDALRSGGRRPVRVTRSPSMA